jgi:hypothetical protein
MAARPAVASVIFPRLMWSRYDGTAMAVSSATTRIAMTSSIRVKPCFVFMVIYRLVQSQKVLRERGFACDLSRYGAKHTGNAGAVRVNCVTCPGNPDQRQRGDDERSRGRRRCTLAGRRNVTN